jgi:Ti-type conjugative transfer relaxase TraA
MRAYMSLARQGGPWQIFGMAIYHLSVKIVQRSKGRSAIAAAAYRAASALYDETLGRTFNYLDKTGVMHSEILLPDSAPARWQDREVLWNEVERVERRKDARLAREIELALPRELSQAEAIALAQDFVREQFVAKGMAADLNIHFGHSADGEKQPHAHIMLTLRHVVPGPAGHPEERAFGLKATEWNDKALLLGWRARWAEMANARLAEAGVDVRIDHRSNAERGIDLEPQHKIGPAGARRAVRGEDAERADEHRAIARRNGEKLLASPELALQALTRQQSTFTKADLARLIHRHSEGAAQFTAIMAKVEASPELVRVGKDGRARDRYSTREMVEIEERLIATAAALNQSATHRVNDKRRINVVNGKHKQLSKEQVLAYLHVTRSRDLSVVTGIAGGGKSKMLGTARHVWQGQGFRVRGAALSGIAAEGLEGSAGIESRTIASWEYVWNEGKEALTAKDVLVVDEAAMIGSRQLSRLLSRAQGAGAKVVLVGDAEQLQAIEAGAAFRAIAERVGVMAITEPRRQLVDWQRRATKELAAARTEAALYRYGMAGLVQAHTTREAARAGVIAAWQTAREQYPEQSQLILAHERVDVRALNEAARAVRRAAGELGADHVLETEAGPQAFAEGDRIYFLRNERGLGVKNGTLGTLTRIEGGRLTVRVDQPGGAGSGKEISFDLADFAHIGHGYAATIHKNQGATVDQAHVLATPGMDRHLTYVAMTRHRHAARLHWSQEDFGSVFRLHDLLGRERAKDTTLDYAEPEIDPVTAYAERRGLEPVALPAPSVPAPLHPTATARGRLRRIGLTPDIQSVVSALRQVIEAQKTAIAAIAEMVVRPTPAPKPKPAPRDMFDGLRLNTAPLSAPAPEPKTDPLSAAIAELLLASRDGRQRSKAGLPLLPHQQLAIDQAHQKIDALRSGFADDLVAASMRDPLVAGRAEKSAEGMAALIADGEAMRAERHQAEWRRAEQAELAPIRERLLKERMEEWWSKAHPYIYKWERSDKMRAEAKPVEDAHKQEIARMPTAELQRIERDWAEAERISAAKEAAAPAPRSGPSPF